MPWNDFTGDSVCGGICAPAVCLRASWLCWHVFPVICHPCLPPGDGCDSPAISVWWQPAGRGNWQQQPPHWQLGKGWGGRGGPWSSLGFGFSFATPCSPPGWCCSPCQLCPPALSPKLLSSIWNISPDFSAFLCSWALFCCWGWPSLPKLIG